VSEPVWLSRLIVTAMHNESLANYGGLPGLRDDGLLRSAIARKN
jgi:death-on-curing protein